MSGLLQMVCVAYVKDGHGVITLLENQVIYSFKHLNKNYSGLTTHIKTYENTEGIYSIE